MLYLSDATPFRIFSINLGCVTVESPCDFDKCRLIPELEEKIAAIFRKRVLTQPRYISGSSELLPNGNYACFVVW